MWSLWQFLLAAFIAACPLVATPVDAQGAPSTRLRGSNGSSVDVSETMFTAHRGRKAPARNVSAQGNEGGCLFIASHGHLYCVHESSPRGDLWSGGWDPRGPNRGMTAEGPKSVFMVSRGSLYLVTESAKDGGEKWSSDWVPVETNMVAPGDNKGLFISSRSHFYLVLKDKPNGIKLGDSSGVSDMCRDQSKGYVVRQKPDPKSRWYEVVQADMDPVNLWYHPMKFSTLENSGVGRAHIAGGNGGLFIFDVYPDGVKPKDDSVGYTLFFYDNVKGAVEKWSENWQIWATNPASNHLGGVFVMSSGDLYFVDKNHKNGQKWSSGWAGNSKLVKDDGASEGGSQAGGVFILSNGKLYHVHENNKKGDFWSDGWADNALMDLNYQGY